MSDKKYIVKLDQGEYDAYLKMRERGDIPSGLVSSRRGPSGGQLMINMPPPEPSGTIMGNNYQGKRLDSYNSLLNRYMNLINGFMKLERLYHKYENIEKYFYSDDLDIEIEIKHKENYLNSLTESYKTTVSDEELKRKMNSYKMELADIRLEERRLKLQAKGEKEEMTAAESYRREQEEKLELEAIKAEYSRKRERMKLEERLANRRELDEYFMKMSESILKGRTAEELSPRERTDYENLEDEYNACFGRDFE